MFMDCSFIICLTCCRGISTCSKRLIYSNVPNWSELLLVACTTNLLCHGSFSASIRLMICLLKYCPINSLLNAFSGNRSCRLLKYNIITSKPRDPYLPLF